MRESPAWRVLSLSARRVLDRLEIEHAHHGGVENGNLPVTTQNFIDYGVHRNGVAQAIREAEALGFIRMKHGRGGNAEHRQPNRFFLTYGTGCGPRSLTPTHEWRKIKTIEEAQAIADAARAAKDPRAVAFGKKSRPLKRGSKPTPKKGVENPILPTPKIGATVRPLKQGPLSISWGGGGGQRPASAGLDQSNRKSLLEYVANVVSEQLHDLDAARVRALKRKHLQLSQQRLFDAVGNQKEKDRGCT